MSKIAVIGGTFNPVHYGHINMVLESIKMLDIDKVLVVPTNISPHKINGVTVSPYDRIKMCEIAFKDYDNVIVSDIEITRKGISYTSDTLMQIKKMHPNDDIYFIVGADMFFTIQQWHNAEDIFKLAIICVVPRGKDNIDKLMFHLHELENVGAVIKILNVPIIDISSTDIRAKVAQGQDVESMVPCGVRDYIYDHKLYFRGE